MGVDPCVGVQLLGGVTRQVDAADGERLAPEHRTDSHGFHAFGRLRRPGDHVDSDRLERAACHEHLDDDPPRGRHLVFGAHLPGRPDDERAVIAQVDVQGLIEHVLQVGSRETRDVGEQQVEVLGRPGRQTEAQFEAEPALQNPPRVTSQARQHALEHVAVAHPLRRHALLGGDVAQPVAEADQSRVTHRRPFSRARARGAGRPDRGRPRTPSATDAAS